MLQTAMVHSLPVHLKHLCCPSVVPSLLTCVMCNRLT
uniref:Uncharacterized protein n=1 Tax=Anguilla anguilla TaxID=7936 RepID=A0A0E9U1F6_ANGAN